MKKIFNVDQMSVMILAGAIMALAWGCKREAVNVVTDRVIEDVSQTLADGIYRTDEFTEKAISDYINIYDDMELTPCIYQTNYVIGDICQEKYIVINGVIEEIVEDDGVDWIPQEINFESWTHSVSFDAIIFKKADKLYQIGMRDDGVVVWRKAQ